MENGNVTFEKIKSNSEEEKSLFLFNFRILFCSIHQSRKVRKNFFDSVFLVLISIYNFLSNIQNLINRKNSKKEIFTLKIHSKIRIGAY